MEVYHGCLLELPEFFDWLDKRSFTRKERQKEERFPRERLLKLYSPDEEITEDLMMDFER
jgi:hypothetical protein